MQQVGGSLKSGWLTVHRPPAHGQCLSVAYHLQMDSTLSHLSLVDDYASTLPAGSAATPTDSEEMLAGSAFLTAGWLGDSLGGHLQRWGEEAHEVTNFVMPPSTNCACCGQQSWKADLAFPP
mmetsp:Transcript_26021/g.60141  ORF Transcript_26021/g.60141 Transcript_26021/m.60141 type:complete len:122 (+) Transcript_26021:257-622(+)